MLVLYTKAILTKRIRLSGVITFGPDHDSDICGCNHVSLVIARCVALRVAVSTLPGHSSQMLLLIWEMKICGISCSLLSFCWRIPKPFRFLGLFPLWLPGFSPNHWKRPVYRNSRISFWQTFLSKATYELYVFSSCVPWDWKPMTLVLLVPCCTSWATWTFSVVGICKCHGIKPINRTYW